jgi:arabinan endo-1,5-alpha-L-arabinosidase
MHRFFRKALLAVALAGSAWTASADFWTLSGDIAVHDPAIIKETDGLWWTFGTGDGISVLYSSDGKKWTRGTQVFGTAPSWWATYVPAHTGLSVWAPDIAYYNGKYWLYYAISTFGSNTSAIGLVAATSIVKGDWVDKGLVIRSKSGSQAYNAIDPNLTFDADGNPYLVFGSWFSGIQITALDKSTMKPTGSLTTLAVRSAGIEAPVIVYRKSYYYLFVSIDKCCAGVNSTYKIAVGRATKITGPYYDKSGNKMLSGYATVFDSGNTRWVGPGGQDVYYTSSYSVIARHAYDANDSGNPKLLINDLNWTDGWPSY